MNTQHPVKTYTLQPNGVWTYEVQLEPSSAPCLPPQAEVIPVLGPDQMEAWIKSINARLGEVYCHPSQVQGELALGEVTR